VDGLCHLRLVELCDVRLVFVNVQFVCLCDVDFVFVNVQFGGCVT
jgi:hypothetical protein